MRITPAVIALVLAATFASYSFALEPDDYAEAVVLWQAVEPTCFPPTLPLGEQMAALHRFTVGGEVTEPRKVESPPFPQDLAVGIKIGRGVPVFELVISAEGKVESVVSLRPASTGLDSRLGEWLREWRFEPSTLDGKPVCTRFIVTVRINWQ